MSVLCTGTRAQYTTYLDYIKAYKGVAGSNFEGAVGTTAIGLMYWAKGGLPVAIRFNFER